MYKYYLKLFASATIDDYCTALSPTTITTIAIPAGWGGIEWDVRGTAEPSAGAIIEERTVVYKQEDHGS